MTDRDIWVVEPCSWLIIAGAVIYAQRPTREEVEQVLREDEHLIRMFGEPKLLAPLLTALHP